MLFHMRFEVSVESQDSDHCHSERYDPYDSDLSVLSVTETLLYGLADIPRHAQSVDLDFRGSRYPLLG